MLPTNLRRSITGNHAFNEEKSIHRTPIAAVERRQQAPAIRRMATVAERPFQSSRFYQSGRSLFEWLACATIYTRQGNSPSRCAVDAASVRVRTASLLNIVET